jgi:predicted O-linked N-acetylglucosamine transferase (SPINDLY family)
MANDKEIIRKLLKIAENQQKILTKLAQNQELGWSDVSEQLQSKLSTIPAAKNYTVNLAEVSKSDGTLRSRLMYPANDKNFALVTETLKRMLAGTQLADNQGQLVTLTNDPYKIRFIGMT